MVVPAASEQVNHIPAMSGDGSATTSCDDDRALRSSTPQATFAHFHEMLKIMLPGWRTREGGLLLAHSATLVARTVLSTVVARLDGLVVKTIVDQDRSRFAVAMAFWLGIAL